MTYSNSAIVSELSLEEIKTYLIAKRWEASELPDDRRVLYGLSSSNDQRVEIYLPRESSFSDTPLRIRDAVHTLAALNDRSHADMIDEVRALRKDIIKQRMLNLPPGETIPLELASRVVGRLRNLVAYSACIEEAWKPYFAKTTKFAKTIAEKCRLGHTFAGSFGFSLEMPIMLPTQIHQGSAEASSAPIERRIMERIARGFDIISQGIATGNVDKLIATEKGFNANMFDELSSLMDECGLFALEYSFHWSPVWTVSNDLLNTRRVTMTKNAREYLETAARTMRAPRESEPIQVKGYIIHLTSMLAVVEQEDEEEEESDNTVTLLWVTGESRKQLKVPLNMEQYKQACDAHRDGKMVTIVGRPEKIGKYYHLMSPSSFTVLQD